MTQQVINIGGTANDGTGDPLRTAFTKINTNFSELYAKGAAGSNLDLSNNEIAATNSNGNVELVPNGAGRVVVVDDTLVITTSRTPASTGSVGDVAGSIAWDSTKLYICTGNYDGSTVIWKTLSTSSASDITISSNGTYTLSTPSATNMKLVPGTTGDIYLTSDNVYVGDLNTSTVITTNGTGDLRLSTNSGTNSSDILIEQGTAGNILIAGKTAGNVNITHYGSGVTNIQNLYSTSNTAVFGSTNIATTITTNGTANLNLTTNNGTNSGSIQIAQGANNNITLTPNGTGDVVLSADTVVVGDSNATANITSNGTGNLVLNTNSGTNSGSITIAQGTNGNIAIATNGTGITSITRAALAAGTATAGTAPLKFTAGTNLTSAEAGAIEYDGNLFYATRTTTAGRGLLDTSQFLRLNANGSAITTIANFFGAGSNVTLTTGATYQFEYQLFFLKTTTNTVSFTFGFSNAPVNLNAFAVYNTTAGSNTGYVASTVAQSANATITTVSLTDAINHAMNIKVTIDANASTGGTFAFQAAATSGSLTPLRGSYFRYQRVPSTTVGTFA